MNGKVVSYRFTACVDQDVRGKQIQRYTTWAIPEGLTASKARKSAERAADAWEQETRAEYEKERDAAARGQTYAVPAEKRHDDFVEFMEQTWLPLDIRGGNNKPSTVAFYRYTVKPVT